MRDNLVYLIVSECDSYDYMRLMQYTVPSDFDLRFRAWLDDCRTGRWIGRWGQTNFCEISVFVHVISCCGFGHKGTSADENQDIESTETKITYSLLQTSWLPTEGSWVSVP